MVTNFRSNESEWLVIEITQCLLKLFLASWQSHTRLTKPVYFGGRNAHVFSVFSGLVSSWSFVGFAFFVTFLPLSPRNPNIPAPSSE